LVGWSGGGGGGTLDWTLQHDITAPIQRHGRQRDDGQRRNGWWPTFPISSHLTGQLERSRTLASSGILHEVILAPGAGGGNVATSTHAVTSIRRQKQLAPQDTAGRTNNELAAESIAAPMPAARNRSSRSEMSRDMSKQFTVDASKSAPGVTNLWGVELTTSRDTCTSTARVRYELLPNEEEEEEGTQIPALGAYSQAVENGATFSHTGQLIRFASCWNPKSSKDVWETRHSPVSYVSVMVRGKMPKMSSLTVLELLSLIHAPRLGLGLRLLTRRDRVWDVP
jgi:hypothetical protein